MLIMGESTGKDLCKSSKSKVRNKKVYSKRKRVWADLPQDLLELIMGRLLFIDQISFRATCRNWRSLARVPPLKRLPWLLAFDKPCGGSYILCDPSDKQTYKIKFEHDVIFFPDTELCASKFGWLLVHYRPRRNLYFFNPFTKELITLPFSKIRASIIATFSSPPTDPECMIIVLGSSGADIKISMRVLKHKRWKTYKYTSSRCIHSVVYSQRNLYFSDDLGAVGMFNIDTVKLKFLAVPKLIKGDSYLVDCNGEILRVLLKKAWNEIRILRCDFLKMEWVEVTRLGNRTLFVDCTSVAIQPTVRELVDTVHFHSDGISKISFGKSKCISLKDNDQTYDCTKYYGSVAEDTEFHKVWIEPPY